MTIALLPAPRRNAPTQAHSMIIAQAIQEWLDKEYRREHPVTRILVASETITTTRTVIAVERQARTAVHTDPADVIDGTCKEDPANHSEVKPQLPQGDVIEIPDDISENVNTTPFE